MIPESGAAVREKPGSSPVNREFSPTCFRSEAFVTDEATGQTERVPLYQGEPMIFRLGKNWQGDGRRVRGVSFGHFIVITPVTFSRRGDPPVTPEACSDAAFRAHYFFRSRDDAGPVQGFAEHPNLSSSVIVLAGTTVFDDSEEGELFVGQPPDLTAPAMAWARVGEEGKKGWGENYRLNEASTLADVLDGREGRFFVRVYRQGSSVATDSVQFRYIECLRELRVNGAAYNPTTVLMPGSNGHSPANVEFVGKDNSPITAVRVMDGRHAFEIREGAVVWQPGSDATPMKFRVGRSANSSAKADVVVAPPWIWWRMVVPGAAPPPWAATTQQMTRNRFRRLASRDARLEISAPARERRLGVSFGKECGAMYTAKTEHSSRNRFTVPFTDFRYHTEINSRLLEDAVLRGNLGAVRADLIRIVADPAPTVVEFSAVPDRVGSGQPVVVRWNVANSEGVTVSILPDIGQVGGRGSREVWVEPPCVVAITLVCDGMQTISKEIAIRAARRDRNVVERPVAYAKSRAGWRQAKGFSPGEVAATAASTASLRVDRRRRSVHGTNVECLRKWMK